LISLPPRFAHSPNILSEELMRRFSTLLLVGVLALAFVNLPLLAAEEHSCMKADKACCKEMKDCCKDAEGACCAKGACCDDAKCCTTAADGTHSCAMKHADGEKCTHSCCKDAASCHTHKS